MRVRARMAKCSEGPIVWFVFILAISRLLWKGIPDILPDSKAMVEGIFHSIPHQLPEGR